jgi:murein DD-endopeptidase MepM/ murein hydrolase activator NlpD
VTGAGVRAAALGVGVLAAVVVPALGAPPAASRSGAGPRPTAEPSHRTAGPDVRVHEVRAGDTLGALARRHGVTVSGLVAVNRLRGPSAILRVGQRLRIPEPTAVARAVTAPVATVSGRRAARRPPRDRMPRNLVLAVPDFVEIAPLFAWPVEGPVSSAFGRRRIGWHRGIDIKADLGLPITAAAGGLVIASGYETRYGRVIKIEHANGFMTVYAHNDENFVEIGDRIGAGQRIGSVGRTGRATAHHLHFEIRQAGLAYNPLYLLPLPPRVTTVEESEEEEPDEADD